MINFFAKTNFRDEGKLFGIKRGDRKHHLYLIGKTGMGKTTLLLNMILNDIFSKQGVCVIDPHGDLTENILNYIPKSRIEDVIYFNPADTAYPIPLNPLAKGKVKTDFLVSGLISLFKKTWKEFWGPRLEYLLRNSILTLLEGKKNPTLADINRILSNRVF